MSPNEIILIAFYIAILIYSVIIHEVSHGLAALSLGDPTAKYAGRLTMNPVSHIDPMMTIFVPVFMLILSGGRFAFGGAKPVPYNPYNLKNQKWGPAAVALAGPLSNIFIALVAAFLAKIITIPILAKQDILGVFYNILSGRSFIDNMGNLAEVFQQSFGNIFFGILIMIIIWNVILAFFNLIPIPPLDGSKLLFSIFNLKIETVAIFEQFGFIILVAFIVLFPGLINLFLSSMLNLFLGITT